MSTVATPLYEWKTIPWPKVERMVFKLQKRIFQAQQRGNTKLVHQLQRLLMQSWSAKCLAVRRVTQDNRGKKTAGVDGVKSLTPPQRLALVKTLRLSPKAQPTRRVWIPKPGTEEKRPLGIPVMADRAGQALVKLALEPEWEGKFEPNSYGFRPGRSAHDAIEALLRGASHQSKYVLDADITKCFDKISHSALLQKLHTTPTLRRAIRAWLKAGVLDDGELFPTEEGTPQGGVASPLLANIALHGLETTIRAAFPKGWSSTSQGKNGPPTVVRYADDIVVLHQNLAALEKAKEVAAEWLQGMGLEWKPSKTRIVHTLHEHAGHPPGFDFLGFELRQYPVGNTHSARQTHRKDGPVKLLGFKTIIKPSKTAQQRHRDRLRQVLRQARATTQADLIARLNPILRGWSNYYATVSSKQVFCREDHVLVQQLLRWAKRRHHHEPVKKAVRKYWRLETGKKWDFATRDGVRLYTHAETPIRRHIKVRGEKSPYDGDWGYWATRMGRHPELPKRVGVLLKKQQGRCSWCGLHFGPNDGWEVDHVVPKSQGGREEYANWQLLHGHCHDQKTAEDGSSARVPMT